jgi:hypothetical protein
MKSLEPGDDSPVRTSGQTRMDVGNVDDRSVVVGNERMTALAGAVLLVLILVELVTAAYLRTLLSAHVLVGVLLAGPLAAILLLPIAAPWIAWSQTNGTIPAPMIVGMLVAILALLATRPLRWSSISRPRWP